MRRSGRRKHPKGRKWRREGRTPTKMDLGADVSLKVMMSATALDHHSGASGRNGVESGRNAGGQWDAFASVLGLRTAAASNDSKSVGQWLASLSGSAKLSRKASFTSAGAAEARA